MFWDERQARLACAQLLLNGFGAGGGAGPKGKAKGKGKKGSGHGVGWGGSMGDFGLALAGGPVGGARGRRPTNEWNCPACEFANRSYRANCYRCGAVKPRGAGGKGEAGKGGKGGRNPARTTDARGAKAGKGPPATGPINEFGHAPLLGRCHGPAASTSLGGAWGGKAGTKGKGKGVSNGKEGRGGGLDGGLDGDGYTVVNYRLGQRPRVPTDQTQTQTQNPAPARADSTMGTRFHVLADDDDDYATRDAVDEDRRMDDEQMATQQGDQEGPWHEEEDAPSPLEQAKEQLQRRQKMHRAAKNAFGANSPEAKEALADVEAAQEHYRSVRGPKAWYEQARQLEKKAEAKIRSRDKHRAELEASEEWYNQQIAQLQAEQQARRADLEAKIDQETQEAEDLRTQVEQVRGTDGRDAAEWPAGGSWGGASNEEVSELARQLASAQELAAQSQASEDLQQILAQIGAKMADIEGREDDGYYDDDGIDGDDDRWDDDDEVCSTAPPWRNAHNPRTHSPWREGRAIERRTDGYGGHGASPQGSENGGRSALATGSGAKESDGPNAKSKPDAKGGGPKGRGKGAPPAAATAASLQGGGAQMEIERPTAGAATTADAEATAAAAAAEAKREERRRKGIDKLRGQLQMERERDLAARQQQAGIGTLEAAQTCSAQQLAQSEEQLAKYYSDTQAEAERRYALLSEEEQIELVGEQFW